MQVFSLAETARIAGARPRSVQLWAEAGSIIPEDDKLHAGRGRHRQFSRSEVAIACVLQAFARRNLPIGELVKVGALLRGGSVLESIESHAERNVPTYLIINWWGEDEMTMRVSWTDPKHGGGIEPQLSALGKDNGMAAVIQVNTYLKRLPA
jgi:DNA-binding transcriptional MerR regulator